jgi:hypothetical protein
VECCASTTLTMASLGGVVQRGHDDGRGVMDLHLTGALSADMVASMAGLPRAMRSSALKMDQRLMAMKSSEVSA